MLFRSTVILEPFTGLQEGAQLPPQAEQPKAEQPKGGIPSASDSTSDLGIPDIDALMQLSGEEQPAAKSGPAAAAELSAGPDTPAEPADAFPVADSAPAEPEAAPEPAAPAAEIQAEQQPEAAVPQPADVFNPPQAEDLVIEPSPEPAPEADATLRLEPEALPEAAAPVAPAGEEPSMDDLAAFERQMAAGAAAQAPEPQDIAAFTLEPEAGAAVPGAEKPELLPENVANAVESQFQEQAGIQLEPQGGLPEPAAEPAAIASAETVNPEPPAGPSAEPAAQELSIGIPAADETLQQPAAEPPPQEPALNAGAGEPMTAQENDNTIGIPKGDQPPGLGGGHEEPALTVGGGDADKTVVVNPEPHEEKTVIFQASSAPGITSSATSSDLAELSSKQTPAGIPDERVRSLFFLYAPQDSGMCASLLAEIDAVCSRSQTSPMFIKRAGVNLFDPDMNSNFVLQTVTDSGAAGLVCVGGIPQEKVYEIENVFNSSPLYFRHVDADSFSHSTVLNLVLDMIVR